MASPSSAGSPSRASATSSSKRSSETRITGPASHRAVRSPRLLGLPGASIVHGVRLGAAIQVLSFGGFWLGLFIGALLAPHIADAVSGSVAKAVVSLIVVFGLAAILGGIGRVFGVRLWRVLHRARL